ncbi:MAG: hypothetical protein AAGA12_02295 [Pseudomonadota bacterium]
MSRFTWSKEPKPPKRGYDPFAVWTMTYGDGFSLRDTQTISDPKDFTYQVVLRNTEVQVGNSMPPNPSGETPVLGPCVSNSTFERDRESVERRTEVSLSTDDVEEEASDAASLRQVMRYTAPLRASSIGPKSFAKPEYAAHSLDPRTAVLVGVVDDGFNLVNGRFAQTDGTTTTSRIEFAWVQDGVSAGKSGTVAFGREHTRTEIEALLNSGLSEDEQLEKLGLLDFTRPGGWSLAGRLSHGTHVLDTAAGFDPRDTSGLAKNCRIVTVQLPQLVTVETSGAQLAPFAVAGIGRILSHAYEMSVAEGFPIPVVINFSYAIAGGPHDGSSILETAIDTLVAAHIEKIEAHFDEVDARFGVKVVLPTGNRFLARGHARQPAAVAALTKLSLPWRIQPQDVTSNFCEIWLPATAQNVSLSLSWPGGTAVQLSDLSRTQAMVLTDTATGDVLARASMDQQGRSGSAARKQRILIALAPSAMPSQTSRRPGPSGLWQVGVEARLNDGDIEAWIPRDDAPIGYFRPGLQSYFDDPAYQRFTPMGFVSQIDTPKSDVHKQGTISGMATSPRITVVGAATKRDENPSYYAASSEPSLRQPDYSAFSDCSRVLAGRLASGSRSGSVLPMNGTSVAAPQASRAMMQAFQGKALDPKVLNPRPIPPFDGAPIGPRLGEGDLSRPARALESQR